MFNILLGLIAAILLASVSQAGVLPMSRGGTGAALTPSANKICTSGASALQLSSSIQIPAAGTVVLAAGSSTAAGTAPLYIPSGTTMTTKEKGAIESNGTNLYWTDSSGNRYKFNFTLTN